MGARIALDEVTARHNASVGICQFGQWDYESVSPIANRGWAPPLAQNNRSQATWRRYATKTSSKHFPG